VTDEEGRRHSRRGHGPGGDDKVIDVGRKASIAERSAADPGAREIEPEDSDSGARKRARDARSGETVLAAGEAVREDRPPAGSGLWRVEPAREAPSAAAIEIEHPARHSPAPKTGGLPPCSKELGDNAEWLQPKSTCAASDRRLPFVTWQPASACIAEAETNVAEACWRVAMFSVLFEVQPNRDEWDVYLARADMLRAELERAPGFVDSIHYGSLTRDGWILSLSGWSDEPSAAGWHTRMRDDEARRMFPAHRLRMGEVRWDTRDPEDQTIAGHGGTGGAGEGTHITLIDAKQTLEWVSANNPQEMALYLGFDLYSYGDCISWDIFNSLSSPGEIILLVTWKNAESANDHAATQIVPDDARVRVIRVDRDSALSEIQDAAQTCPAAGDMAIRA
jgi:hypothetical protein